MILGTTVRVSKGDTRSLDYSSCNDASNLELIKLFGLQCFPCFCGCREDGCSLLITQPALRHD